MSSRTLHPHILQAQPFEPREVFVVIRQGQVVEGGEGREARRKAKALGAAARDAGAAYEVAKLARSAGLPRCARQISSVERAPDPAETGIGAVRPRVK